MLYWLYQRIVIGLGTIVFALIFVFGIKFVDQLGIQGFLLGLARIFVGIVGLAIFFMFFALSQYNQPDPRGNK